MSTATTTKQFDSKLKGFAYVMHRIKWHAGLQAGPPSANAWLPRHYNAADVSALNALADNIVDGLQRDDGLLLDQLAELKLVAAGYQERAQRAEAQLDRIREALA